MFDIKVLAPSEIKELPSCQDLDDKVAQVLFKAEPWKVLEGRLFMDFPGVGVTMLPHYSSHIEAAWKLVELRGSHWEVSRGKDGYQAVVIFDGETECGGEIVPYSENVGRAFAKTAPLAICRAALLAARGGA